VSLPSSIGTWGDNSRSARGTDDRQLALDRMQSQREAGGNPLDSKGPGVRATAPRAPCVSIPVKHAVQRNAAAQQT
jgi:hypothetical protein